MEEDSIIEIAKTRKNYFYSITNKDIGGFCNHINFLKDLGTIIIENQERLSSNIKIVSRPLQKVCKYDHSKNLSKKQLTAIKNYLREKCPEYNFVIDSE